MCDINSYLYLEATDIQIPHALVIRFQKHQGDLWRKLGPRLAKKSQASRPIYRPMCQPPHLALPFDLHPLRTISTSYTRRHAHPSTRTWRNLGQTQEGDDGRRNSSELSKRWLRPSLAAMASLRGCAMADFKS